MDFESLKKTYEADYCWEHPDSQVELFEDPEASNPKIYDLIEWFEEDVNNMFAMRNAWKVCLLIFCRAYCFFKYKNGNKYFLDFRMFESIISKLRIKTILKFEYLEEIDSKFRSKHVSNLRIEFIQHITF